MPVLLDSKQAFLHFHKLESVLYDVDFSKEQGEHYRKNAAYILVSEYFKMIFPRYPLEG